MKKSEVVGGSFFPTDGEAACAVKPTKGALDDPATGFPSGSCLRPVLATFAQVQDVAFGLSELAGLRIVIALI